MFLSIIDKHRSRYEEPAEHEEHHDGLVSEAAERPYQSVQRCAMYYHSIWWKDKASEVPDQDRQRRGAPRHVEVNE
jgi:hypothetical protein